MRVKLQLVMCDDHGQATTVTDLVTLKKGTTRFEPLGLTLKEAKQLLKTIQQQLLAQQIDRFLARQSRCPDCGALLKAKSYTNRSFRTLFGTCKLASPRLFHCRCQRRIGSTVRPGPAGQLGLEDAMPS